MATSTKPMSANRRYSRWRGVHRALSWACLIGMVGLALIWFESRWFYVGGRISLYREMYMGGGKFHATTMFSGSTSFLLGRHDTPRWEWDFFYKLWYGDYTLSFPLRWPICALAACWLMLRWLPRVSTNSVRCPRACARTVLMTCADWHRVRSARSAGTLRRGPRRKTGEQAAQVSAHMRALLVPEALRLRPLRMRHLPRALLIKPSLAARLSKLPLR